MRFYDFYIRYKILSKELKNEERHNLPRHRIILLILIAVLTVFSFIFIISSNPIWFGIMIFLMVLSCIIIYIYENRINIMENMLNTYYKPYSKNRVNKFLDLLREYNINPEDTEKLDLLIAEAVESQKDYDYFNSLTNTIKFIFSVIISMIAFIAGILKDNISGNKMLSLTLMALIFVVVLYFALITLKTVIKDIFYLDYNYHSDLIKDLRQLKIFYNSDINNTTILNDSTSTFSDISTTEEAKQTNQKSNTKQHNNSLKHKKKKRKKISH